MPLSPIKTRPLYDRLSTRTVVNPGRRTYNTTPIVLYTKADAQRNKLVTVVGRYTLTTLATVAKIFKVRSGCGREFSAGGGRERKYYTGTSFQYNAR